MARNRNTTDGRLFSAEETMKNTLIALISDFRTLQQDATVYADILDALRISDIGAVRKAAERLELDEDSIYKFKMDYQVKSLLKRYRFEKDLYTTNELEQKAISTFFETQGRIAAVELHSLEPTTIRILDRAAKYVADLLGPYDGEEHRRLCMFGKRASVGIPSRLACEAARWELPISGSSDQIDWFDSEMSQMSHVQDYWTVHFGKNSIEHRNDTYQEISSLKLTLVPKSYKSLRSIMPNTTIGSYMSYGIGAMMRDRLKRKGYDLRTLQNTHKSLARKASIDSSMTTADLSSASDSISVDLVERLLPPDWYSVLRQSRISTVTLPNNLSVDAITFSTMGIGYTFPLQTLVFLALLNGIQDHLIRGKDRQLISVYGDDLVYSSRMHKYVASVFKQLGFVLNVDKTFSTGHFRESCGGDYLHGVDVRPFQPESGPVFLTQIGYEAMLYKLINGLLRRWSEHEIGCTLNYLTSRLSACAIKAKMVPVDYPDDAGILCTDAAGPDFIQSILRVKPRSIGHGVYRFSFLRIASEDRKEERSEPYYWRNGKRDSEPDYRSGVSHGLQRVVGALARFLHLVHGTDCTTPLLVDKRVRSENPDKTYWSPGHDALPKSLVQLTLERSQYRLEARVVVPRTGLYKSQRGVSCFERPLNPV